MVHAFRADIRGQKARIAAVLGCRSLFGRGNGVACLEETCGLCGKRILPPQGTGSRLSGRDDTGCSLMVVVCFGVWWLFQKTGSRVKHALARDDAVYSLVESVSGEPFHHFTFPPFHLQRSCRSCYPCSISFSQSPPHHDITTPRSPFWTHLSTFPLQKHLSTHRSTYIL